MNQENVVDSEEMSEPKKNGPSYIMSDGLANCCVSHRIPIIAIAPSATLVSFALGATAYISHFVLRVVLMMSRVACASLANRPSCIVVGLKRGEI